VAATWKGYNYSRTLHASGLMYLVRRGRFLSSDPTIGKQVPRPSIDGTWRLARLPRYIKAGFSQRFLVSEAPVEGEMALYRPHHTSVRIVGDLRITVPHKQSNTYNAEHGSFPILRLEISAMTEKDEADLSLESRDIQTKT
jgi:hypothetical protein